MVFYQMDIEEFIINPEEDDVKPGVIFGRSFLRLTKAITDFGVGTVTIYLDIDIFLEETKEEGKCNDDWDHLLDFNIDDVPLLGTSSSAGGHLTQEEAAKEAIAIRMSQKFALLEEERPIIETMAYNDKYKKILYEVWKDKVELDGKIVKEDKEAVKRIKGEALKEKDDPGAFIFPIRLEGQTNTSYLKTLKNSRPLPNFEEYAIDTPYMILWSKIKKNTFSANTPYPKTPILRIGQYFVSKKTDMAYWSIRRHRMDDFNMTMEEYIKFEEEKARRRGRVFNWKTTTYGKVRVDDDLYDLRSVEAEFPAIVIDDTVTPQDALQCKSQVSIPVNDEINFRISFDESDDEDYTIIYDINSFSYKMISVNNLKTDSENDNEKAGIPSFLPPKPTNNYIDDLDFFNDFENEFPAIGSLRMDDVLHLLLSSNIDSERIKRLLNIPYARLVSGGKICGAYGSSTPLDVDGKIWDKLEILVTKDGKTTVYPWKLKQLTKEEEKEEKERTKAFKEEEEKLRAERMIEY
ncbi:hypothetical protein Tco_0419364 [Tanacetum coccineum]